MSEKQHKLLDQCHFDKDVTRADRQKENQETPDRGLHRQARAEYERRHYQNDRHGDDAHQQR